MFALLGSNSERERWSAGQRKETRCSHQHASQQKTTSGRSCATCIHAALAMGPTATSATSAAASSSSAAATTTTAAAASTSTSTSTTATASSLGWCSSKHE